MNKAASKTPLKDIPVDTVVRVSYHAEPLRIIHHFPRFALLMSHLDGSIVCPVMLPNTLQVLPVDNMIISEHFIFGFYSGDL